MTDKHILITGGAGYIGSLLTSELLRQNYRVTLLDSLLFGGESILPFLSHPNFHFIKSDVTEPRAVRDAVKKDWQIPDAVIHLAGIVGFPACQAVGRQVAWRYNVEATKTVYGQAADLGVERFVFASTYSNYGLSEDGKPVTEETPLNPQSLYAETKIAAEEYLLAQQDSPCAPLLFRFATLYGISPRTRFDLIVNQFVLEAFIKRQLVIYQRGYSRSFVHIRDVARGVIMGLEAGQDKIRGQVFNLGTENGNYSKNDIVGFVLKRMPETVVEYKDLTFGGDMRDITVSFEKIRRVLGFETTLTVDDGVREVLFALKSGLIKDPTDDRYRNAQFIVQ
ncbi:MAG: NAD(P)-dependent oxidoreductase [Chloroflexi bacterium CFX1]|nr:NAD(P)-dependent oxidoreductase [Chloroflexi bacterium CFX1]MCQ3951964.1 NAD(P)-dependent oxidoreductase [Chloroflexota bacterium]MDL1919562.1 NAD(P)-dependent oxidoreductase [Chloroflexi bacterium CFX5]NUQ58253.1 NAD(P)-dependent oxidoreductase [Anaerolineales bacterium]